MVDPVGLYNDLERQTARNFIRELARAVRSARLFEADHPTLDGLVDSLRKRWDAATAGGTLSLRFTETAVLLGEDEVFHAASRSDVLPGGLFDHGVAGLLIKRGLDAAEGRRLILALAAGAAHDHVDPAALLWEADLVHVQVLLDADADDLEEIETPEQFARSFHATSDPQDASAPHEFVSLGEGDATDGDVFALSEHERELVAATIGDDTYGATLTHLSRILERMATEQLSPDEGTVVELAMERVVEALADRGDIEAVTETIARARKLRSRGGDGCRHLAEAMLACAREPERIERMLDALESRSALRALDLAPCLAALGRPAAIPLARWLGRTRHHDAACEAMRVLGRDAHRVLADVYRKGTEEQRSALRMALVDLDSPDTLAAVSDHFESFPDEVRVRIVRLGERSDDPVVRDAVVAGLADPHAQVRAVAIAAVRRSDADAVARFVADHLGLEGFPGRSPEENAALFEMLGRIGNGAVASLLVEACDPTGVLARWAKPTPMQQDCLRAMRRMRSPEAREVLRRYAERAPAAFRKHLASFC